jgi:hypothetical protein
LEQVATSSFRFPIASRIGQWTEHRRFAAISQQNAKVITLAGLEANVSANVSAVVDRHDNSSAAPTLTQNLHIAPFTSIPHPGTGNNAVTAITAPSVL